MNQQKDKTLHFFNSQSNKEIYYHHGLSLEGRLNTNGWQINTNYFIKNNIKKTTSISLSFLELKHEKEVRQKNNSSFISSNNLKENNYIFGKINNVYSLNLGFRREIILIPNIFSSKKNIKLRYQVGLSLGMLKPYYLKIINPNSISSEEFIITSERYNATIDNYFLNPTYILGADKWIKGLNQMKFFPGLNGDFSINLGSAKNRRFINAVATGMNFSIFSNHLPILAYQKSSIYQAHLYIALELGGRW